MIRWLYVAAALSLLATNAARAETCYEGKTFVTASGVTACQKVLTVSWVSTTSDSLNVFDVPTWMVVQLFRPVPVFGYMLNASYQAEGKGNYKTVLTKPPGYERYEFCDTLTSVWSQTRGASGNWGNLPETKTTFYFRRERPGWFRGRSWYKAWVAVIWAHPEWTNVGEAKCRKVEARVASAPLPPPPSSLQPVRSARPEWKIPH